MAESKIFPEGTFKSIPPFSRKPVTNRLIEFFAASRPGDEFSNDEIDRAAGCTADAWRGVMSTVRKVLRERYNMLLVTVPGVGVKHATDVDVVVSTKDRSARAHRQFKRGADEYRDAVKDHSKLTPDQQRIGIMVTTMAGLTSPKAARAVASSKISNGELNAGNILALMQRKLSDSDK